MTNAVLASVGSSESGDVGLNIDAMTDFEKEITRSWPLSSRNVLSPDPIKLPQGTILYHDRTTGVNRTFFLLKDDPVVRKINAESIQSVARGFLARRRVAKMEAEMKDESSPDNSQQVVDDKGFSTTGTVFYVNEDGVASSSRHTMIPPRRPQCSPKKTKVDESSSRFPYPLSRYATEEDRNKRNEKLKRVPPPPPPPLSTHPSVIRHKRNKAASIIQRAYHAHVDRLFYLEMNETLIPAAKRIQALVRSVQAREAYYISIYSAMRIQALVRGVQARSRLPIEKCQAVVEVTSDWDKFRRFVSDENWAAVESTLDQYPEVAEKVDPSSGETLLHMVCRHPNVPALILDMVIVLYPKALRHSNFNGTLPLHHAAAHDNMTAMEIVYSVHKDGVNHVDEEGRQPFHVAADSNSIEAVKFLFDEATEQHKVEVRVLEQELADVNSSLAVIKELRMQESAKAKRQIQELEAKVQAWVELGILKDMFNPPPQP